MNLNEIILNRRSIRKFTPRIVGKEEIIEIIRAAMYAPSAVNRQPWHFVVIDNRKTLEDVMRIHPNAGMLSTAPLAILICGDEERQHDTNYWTADCGAATENLLLSASALGLGSCWIGIYPRLQRMQAFHDLFALPPHIQAFALIALGYPAEKKDLPDRFDPSRIYHNSWGKKYSL
jgi:nitroreductase